MTVADTIGRKAVRVLLGYLAACLIASFLVFIISVGMTMGDEPMAGRTVLGEIANMAGWMPFYFIAAAIFAAPVALIGIAISEIAKIERMWFFLALGAIAPLPLVFGGTQTDTANALEGILIFAPVGVLAAAAFWLVRHRKWPV